MNIKRIQNVELVISPYFCVLETSSALKQAIFYNNLQILYLKCRIPGT
jgi:hypothetical protein